MKKSIIFLAYYLVILICIIKTQALSNVSLYTINIEQQPHKIKCNLLDNSIIILLEGEFARIRLDRYLFQTSSSFSALFRYIFTQLIKQVICKQRYFIKIIARNYAICLYSTYPEFYNSVRIVKGKTPSSKVKEKQKVASISENAIWSPTDTKKNRLTTAVSNSNLDFPYRHFIKQKFFMSSNFVLKFFFLGIESDLRAVKKGQSNRGIVVRKQSFASIFCEQFEVRFEKILYFFILALFAYGYTVIRLNLIKKKIDMLEEIIRIKTLRLNLTLKELEVSKDQMGQQIFIYSRLLASITHDIESPLRYIGFSSKQIPGMIEKDQSLQAANLGLKISDVSERLSTMIRDLLDYIKVQVYGNRLHFESINLKALVDLKFDLFKTIIDKNGNNFANEVSPFLNVFSDRRFLSIIIHNLIDNAAKNTYNGKITIHTVNSDSPPRAQLVITNTGTGITSQFIEMKNSTTGETSLDEILENGEVSGLGLLLVKEVAVLAGISIKVIQTDITSFIIYFEQ